MNYINFHDVLLRELLLAQSTQMLRIDCYIYNVSSNELALCQIFPRICVHRIFPLDPITIYFQLKSLIITKIPSFKSYLPVTHVIHKHSFSSHRKILCLYMCRIERCSLSIIL